MIKECEGCTLLCSIYCGCVPPSMTDSALAEWEVSRKTGARLVRGPGRKSSACVTGYGVSVGAAEWRCCWSGSKTDQVQSTPRRWRTGTDVRQRWQRRRIVEGCCGLPAAEHEDRQGGPPLPPSWVRRIGDGLAGAVRPTGRRLGTSGAVRRAAERAETLLGRRDHRLPVRFRWRLRI